MVWKIEVSAWAEQDIALLFDFFAESYVQFGESPLSADAQAKKRISHILDEMDSIAVAPFRGESHENWLPGLRHLTLGKAIYWYQVDAQSKTIRVLAIFYGSQNHIRRMLVRLLYN